MRCAQRQRVQGVVEVVRQPRRHRPERAQAEAFPVGQIHQRAERDAGVDSAVRGKIADRAAIDAAAVGFERVDDLHRPDLRRAGHGAGREAGDHGIDRVLILPEAADDIGDDVHDMAVALDRKALRHPDRTDFGDAADVVAAEVEQHQMLGALLGIGQQFGGERPVLGRRRPPRPGAGAGPLVPGRVAG